MKKALLALICLFAMMAAGTGLKAQEVTIPLMPGWNWISYPSAETVDFATAFGSFTPMEGDKIVNPFDFAVYTEEGWGVGDLEYFYPGYGYMYYSSRNMPVFLTFNPQQPTPQVVVTTSEPTDITTNSATCGGNVTSSSGDYVFVFLKGICWGTNPNPTFNDNYIEAGNGLGSFTVSMTELTSGSTYYVRAFAVTPTGTFYGEEQNFITLSGGGVIGGHEYVDLGLPSGLLWATCNVGADAPEEYGDYFAWGETQPKDYYDPNWSNYQYSYGGSFNNSNLTKYCNNSSFGYNGFTDSLTTLLPEDDAATANWGNGWHMPTKEEWQELFLNTSNQRVAQNDVDGWLFTAPNGNTLFLPAAGIRTWDYLSNDSNGYYWSSSLSSSSLCAWHFGFDSEMMYGVYVSGRAEGCSIRAVCSSVQNSTPTGAINGKFTINANGDQVYFSQGNLQYQASTNTWKFADNQYDYVGSTNSNISSFYSGWIDLFGWGTSGYHDANDPYNVNYQPWSTSTSQVNSSYNNYGYGPSINMIDPNLTGTNANYDWGVYNPISNGGNQTNQWRTLTMAEWIYIFDARITTSGSRYAKANVNNVNGVILLPDNWSMSIYNLSNTNMSDASYNSNTLTTAQWGILEQSGAVFLPASGNRSENSVDFVGSKSSYWSASYGNSYSARRLYFDDSFLSPQGSGYRSYGLSVRLVSPVE